MASLSLRLLSTVVAGLEVRHLGDVGVLPLLDAATQLERSLDVVCTQMTRKQQSKMRQLLHQMADRAQKLSRSLTEAEVAAHCLPLHSKVQATCLTLSVGLRALTALKLDADDSFRLCGALELVLRAGVSCAAHDSHGWLAQVNMALIAISLQPNSQAAATFVRTAARPELLLPFLSAAVRAMDEGWTHWPADVRAAVPTSITKLAACVLSEERCAQHRAALAANPALVRTLAAFLLRRCLPEAPAAAAKVGGQGERGALLNSLNKALTDRCMIGSALAHLQQPGDAAAAVQHAADAVQQLPAAQSSDAAVALLHVYASVSSLMAMPCHTLTGLPPPGFDEAAAAAGSGGGSGSRGGGHRNCSSGGQAGACAITSSGGSADAGVNTDSSPGASSSEIERVRHLRAACGAMLGAFPRLAALIMAAAAEGSPLLQPVTGGRGSEAAKRRDRQHILACLLSTLAHSVGLAKAMRSYVAHLPEMHCWMAAAEAAVRLQPTLARLQRCPGLISSTSLADQARWLAHVLLDSVWGALRPMLVPLGPLDDEAAATQRASLGNRMWQLHSASTRWLHSLLAEERLQAGRVAASLGLAGSGGREWGLLLFHLNLVFLRAHETMRVHDHGAELGPTAAAQLAALCAGHWEAVQALAAAAEPGGGLDLATEDDFSVLLKAYHRMASTCPFLATPTFFTPLIQAMDRACLSGSVRAPLPGVVEVLSAAAEHPRVAVAAVCSGIVDTTVAVAQDATTDLPESVKNTVMEALHQVERTLLCLEQGVKDACHSLGGGRSDACGAVSSNTGSSRDSGTSGNGSNDSDAETASSSGGGDNGDGSSGQPEDHSKAGDGSGEAVPIPYGPPTLHDVLCISEMWLQRSREVVEQQLAAADRPASLAERAAAVKARLPLCFAVAHNLRFYFDRPEQVAAARMQAADAASARSCAYLACSNLEGRGGPGARQGEGSLKCSACRAVWYCGTACSHADWRAGHKRTCKALGAARQQQQRLGGKPRRTADAGAEEHCWQGSGFVLLGLKF